MLDLDIKEQLKTYLDLVTQPIEIAASLDDSDASREMWVFLTEIAALTDKISLSRANTQNGPQNGIAERTPSFAINRVGAAMKMRFAGIPLGHEFTSLVLALLQAGGRPPKVDDSVVEQIKSLEGEFKFEVFVSLSCQSCPEVVQALNLMAVVNPNISATMIDGALFQSEVESREIMAVPAIYLNGKHFGQGRMTADEILTKLDVKAEQRRTDQLNTKDTFDVLIVGGGPAGAAAAVYAARKGIKVGVVAERFGGQVLDTMGIENFISVKETEGPKFVAALEEHVKAYDVDIMNLQRAEQLRAVNGVHEVSLASGATLRSRSIILATGARWREMNVPGEREYRNRGVAYCPHCDGPLFKGKRVAVIGGGNSGVEAAIDLAGIVSHVTLIEFDGRLRADEVLQRKLRSLHNVRVIVSAQTTEVHGANGKVNGLSYRDRGSNEVHRVELEGVFVQIGLLPNTGWLKGTLQLSARGEIEVDAKGQTSVPGVFAAGDATTTPFKQIIIAAGEGAKTALSAFDYLIRTGTAEADSHAA